MRKPIIGLEIHVELKTKTKMFCDSLNDPDEKHPNINVCPICMGHPGTLPVINREAVEKVIDGLGKVLDGYNGSAKLLIENSAGAGKIIGADIKEIEYILNKLKKFPALAGICLDTQHGFASGYDWSAQDQLPFNWDNIKLIHANDSATDLGSRKDRHEHIGKGKIGMKGFTQIAAFAKKQKIDLICETDYPEVTEDIKVLKKLVK